MIIRKFRDGDEIYIKPIYRICFSGPPWNREVTEEETVARWQDHSSQSGFVCFVAEESQRVVGASWFDTISHEALAQERGRELADFAVSINQTLPLVWIRETIVDPTFQGKGIASQLKERVMQEISEHIAPVILLTRMRDDNTKIVRANEKLGFKRAGIKVASKATPGLLHEYWYLVLEKR